MVCVTKEHNYLMLLNKQLEEGTIDEEEYAREVKEERHSLVILNG